MSNFLHPTAPVTGVLGTRPRRARHRRRALTALGVVGTVSLTATSGGWSQAAGPLPSMEEAYSANTGAAVPETVRIALETRFSTLDPILIGTFPGSQVSYLVGGRLTAFGAGEESGLPELAESLTSSDDVVWTAVLRPDLKFSDGSPLTSQDVAVSIQRVIDAGYHPEFADIAEIDTPDDRTVVFTLSRPRPSFPTIVSQSFAGIWPAARLSNPEDFFQNPVSAGRYVVESADLPTGRLTLVANPNYWGPAPQVERIEIALVPDAATRLAQIQNGDVDYAHNLPATLIAQLADPAHPEVAAFPGGLLSMWVNHQDPVLGDVRVRQAINLAVDREQIVEVALGGLLEPDYAFSLGGDAVVERDLDAARELLVGTPCETGCAFELLAGPGNWQQEPVSLVLQQNLAEIGIEVQLRNLDAAAQGDIVESGEHDAMIGSVGAYTDAPDLMAQALVDPEGLFLTAVFNAGYESPAMHELVQELAAVSVEDRDEVIGGIEELFAQDVPFITLAEAAFVNASRLPDDVLSTTLGWHLNLP